MELRLTPSFFYGSAAAAVMGLSLGLALHGPWQPKAGPPRIVLGSAAAAEPAKPDDEGQVIEASADPAQDPATLYDGYLPPDPLPVTRLKPDRYPDHVQVAQAGAGDAERVDADAVWQDRGSQDRGWQDRGWQDQGWQDRAGPRGGARDAEEDDDELPAAPRPYVPRYSAAGAAAPAYGYDLF